MYISLNPLVAVVENFASEEECNEFINQSKATMKPALVLGPGGVKIPSSHRTGQVGYLQHNTSSVIYDVCERICNVVNIEPSFAEAFQTVHYGVTERYDPHHDGIQSRESATFKRSGQRTLTALLYLNTPEAGGATLFPELKLMIPAERGRLVIFQNTILGTDDIHPLSLHAGMPVERGEKWATNLWFRVGRVR